MVSYNRRRIIAQTSLKLKRMSKKKLRMMKKCKSRLIRKSLVRKKNWQNK